MNIEDIKDGMQRVEVYGQVISVGDTRKVNTKRGEAEVADAVLKDATGEIGLSLWDAQIEAVAEGAYVKVFGAMARTYQGKLQISAGFYGRVEVDPSKQGAAAEEGPPDLTCATCGFTNAGHPGWTFCPKDGEALA